jgi:hypothetical protein
MRNESTSGTPDRVNIVIDCDTCVARDTDACSDCMMSYLCHDEPRSAVVFDLAEWRAVRVLADAGLVPTLRHRASPEASAS